MIKLCSLKLWFKKTEPKKKTLKKENHGKEDKSSNITFEIDIALIHSNPNLAPF